MKATSVVEPVRAALKVKSKIRVMRPYLLFFVLLCLVTSCSYPDGLLQDTTEVTGEYDNIVMIMPQAGFEDSEELTKNTAIIGSEVNFVWSVTDSVGIFPDAGSQIYFSMASGAGQASASFDGGGWALKKGSEYFSYFPFISNFYIHKDAVPLTYVGQTQKGNAQENRADIGKFGYMLAKGVANEETGSLYFNYERLGDLFRVKIPVLPGTYTSLTVRTDSDVLLQKGTFNVLELDLSIDKPVYGNSLTLDLEDVTFQENGTLVAFIMMAPFDYLNRQLTFELTDSEGNVAVSSVRGKTYERGVTYANAPHVSVSPASVSAEGEAGTFSFNIAASGTHAYSIVSDATWLVVRNAPTSGSASVTVAVAENTVSQERTGHIIVSETVSGVLLQNVITVVQKGGQEVGGGTGSGGFEDDDQESGGFSLIFEDTEMTEGESYTFGDDQEEYAW